jgi:hypothetical protein
MTGKMGMRPKDRFVHGTTTQRFPFSYLQIINPLERLSGAEDQTRNKPTHVLKSFGATKDLSKTLHPLGNDLGHTDDRKHGSISLLLFHSLIFHYPSILLNNLPSRDLDNPEALTEVWRRAVPVVELSRMLDEHRGV